MTKLLSNQLSSMELERERLLNRAMSNTWQEMQILNQNLLPSNSSEADARGLSDEEEIRRSDMMGGTVGYGEETLVDFEHDLNELGFRS
jgi:hypothetical protein